MEGLKSEAGLPEGLTGPATHQRSSELGGEPDRGKAAVGGGGLKYLFSEGH